MPPPEYVQWAYMADHRNCQPSAEYASWMADCYETNHDEHGWVVGESWPGYVTFDEWKKRCAKRHNDELKNAAPKALDCKQDAQ